MAQMDKKTVKIIIWVVVVTMILTFAAALAPAIT